MKLCDQIDCTGCGACYNACPKQSISMMKDSEGFLYPYIDKDTCVKCGICQKVCPVLCPPLKYPQVQHPLGVVSLSEEIRKKSSSGGMFTLLSSWFFKRGGIVYGAAFDGEYSVYHRSALTEDELTELRGSKYIQSNVGLTYKEVKTYLNNGYFVLYTGTPCQIAGLRTYLTNIDTTRLYTVDLVCHGVPSAKSFQIYLSKLADKLGLEVAEIKDFQFRQMERWGVTPSFKLLSSKERHYLLPEENLFMHLYLSSRLHRKSCYSCRYCTPERVGDITIADFWGIGENKPFGLSTSSGCSLVLLNSEKGQNLFSDLSSLFYSENRSWDEAFKYNTQLHSVSVCPNDRDIVFDYLSYYNYDKIYSRFVPYYYTFYWRLRRVVGRLLRKLKLR